MHLLLLMHRDYAITVVPNTREQFGQMKWQRWRAGLGLKAELLEDLPQKRSGWGLSLCIRKFWDEGQASRRIANKMILRRGLHCGGAAYIFYMPVTNISVAEEALSLSPAERADLARLLIESLEGDRRTNEEIKVELANRLAQLKSGEDPGVSFDDVFRSAS